MSKSQQLAKTKPIFFYYVFHRSELTEGKIIRFKIRKVKYTAFYFLDYKNTFRKRTHNNDYLKLKRIIFKT